MAIDQQIISNLKQRAGRGDRSVLRSPELKSLYEEIKILPPEQRGKAGKVVNDLRQELHRLVENASDQPEDKLSPIDVTAPWNENTSVAKRPTLFTATQGSIHPLSKEMDNIIDIFLRMGFAAIESRQIDDDYHMFGSLNFPEGHPARDDYDTFMTEEGLIAPCTYQHDAESNLERQQRVIGKGAANCLHNSRPGIQE
jgi:phenylalanyl-tRNA synthetase alpha chain